MNNAVIISPILSPISDVDNYERVTELRSALISAGIGFTGVTELFLGKPRQAFLIVSTPNKELLALAKKFNQESIFYTGKDGCGFISTADKEKTPKGTLKEVDEKAALAVLYSLKVQEDGKTKYFAPN